MEGYDVVVGGIGALATFLAFSGFDVLASGRISWLVNVALALLVGAVVVYVRTTVEPDPEE